MVTNKQIVECLDILISKLDRVNERTKKHTKEIKEIEKKLNKFTLRNQTRNTMEKKNYHNL